MQYVRPFDATVDVDNPINFCTAKNHHLLAELRNKYVGRCFMGAYILGINKILNSGACHIVRTNGTANGCINVRFLADVVVFSRWDVLTNVEIVNNQQILVGVYEDGHRWQPVVEEIEPAEPGGRSPGALFKRKEVEARAVVSILVSRAIESLAVGQKIAIRVMFAQHTPMQPQASIVGALLVCDKLAPAYRLRGVLDQSARAELAPMLIAVEVELKKRTELIDTRKADLWFFELLLYAFRQTGLESSESSFPAWEGGPVWSGPSALQDLEAGASPISALDIIRRAVDGESVPVTGVWSRSLALYRSSPLVAVVRDAAAVPKSWVVVDGTPRAVFAEILKNILDFLVATRELLLVYNSPELINKHLNIWTAMRAEQQCLGAR